MSNKQIYEPTSPEDTPPPLANKFEPTSPLDTPPPLANKFEPTSPVDTPPPLILNSKSNFETMVEFYLASNPMRRTADHKMSELEVRFGTMSKKNSSIPPITKINYDNVVQELQKGGFSTRNPDGLSILRIYMEKPTNTYVKSDNIRAEVVGIDMIQQYCRTNNLQKLIDLPSTVSASADKIKFTLKSPPLVKGVPLESVDFPDFNFRVAYQMEQDFTVRSNNAQRILSSWTDTKKIFRYINRVRFSHPTIPVFADLSIVKGSSTRWNHKSKKDEPIPQYTVQEAKVFSNAEHYEIELEVDNRRVGMGTSYDTPESVLAAIRKCIRLILGVLQDTNYPVAYSERDKVIQTYMKLIHGEDYIPQPNISSYDFIGPSSIPLQIENIQSKKEGDTYGGPQSILQNYTVTDKADGQRRLLYVAPNGRIYMIDTNMSCIFTGTMTKDKTYHDSLLDGEFIKYNKNGEYVGIYAAFDLYYLNGKSVREFSFIPSSAEEEETKCRLPLLNHYIRGLKPVPIVETANACGFVIRCKQFYSSNEVSIFHGCSTILSKVRDGSYEYNTDGLIFTPSYTGVGSDRVGHAGPITKYTWTSSFKWKPPEFNTIDFLVSVKKDKTGKDEIHHIFQEGQNMEGTQVIQYKTLILRCGFDPKKHGYMNPMLDIINDQIPSFRDIDNDKTYKPVAFQPTNPYDPQASLCNVLLYENGANDLVMKSEENEYFEEDTIVEFRYDHTKNKGWKWIPLRVRYDKTTELREGKKNYGNAYHVANGNWHSIHNPVTEEMISMGKNIPEINEDVYYNKSGKDTNTKPLREFHNLFVKRKLILGVSNPKHTLIDYAVGKAGDLPKWMAAKLDFVFGIDVSKDNIENQLDGACARYLNFRKKYNHMPGVLFVNGNSGSNIRNGKALVSEKDKQIARAVFGMGPKDRSELGEGVYKRYGIGEAGFNISSCQFALHYFFESERTVHSFLRNVAECTKVGGYFIGTCYDGETVFNMLKKKTKEEGIAFMRGNIKIYEIIKQYDHSGFPDDELSLGYAVDIYQESINKVFREFLVNFRYLIRLMENYGFTLVADLEARKMGLPNATGLFNELFDQMKTEVERDPRRASEYGQSSQMAEDEKQISFMNRYFVFRKMNNVNAEKVAKSTYQTSAKVEEEEEEEEAQTEEKKEKPVIRKIKGKKIVLNEYSPVSEVPQSPQTPSVPVLGKKISIKIKK